MILMTKILKYLFLMISKVFSFAIFSVIFLLLFLQFETLNLQSLNPIIKTNYVEKHLKRTDFDINYINLKFDKNNNELIFTIDSALKNKINTTEWMLFIRSELKINVLINILEKKIFTFTVSSIEKKEDEAISDFNFYGSLNSLKNTNMIEIKGSAKDLPLIFVKDLWPENLGKGARAWTNRSLFEGVISNLEFDSEFVLKKNGELLHEPVINLDFNFNDINTYYLKGMPPMTDTLGTGHLDFNKFRINLIDGRINLDDGTRIYINNGKFNAFDIKQRHGPGQILIDASSNVGDFFNLLSKHDYISKLVKLNRDNLFGESKLKLQFDFPLKNSVKFSETKTNINLEVGELKIYNKNKNVSIIGDSALLILDYDINEARFFKGSIKTKSIKILELPVFAQILDVSIPGLSNISDGGRDITFGTSNFDVELSNQGINIFDGILKPESNLPVVGNSLGLSISGKYFFDEKLIDFNGTVVPVSWLNNLPSNVPILGELFSGSKDGEGLIGIKFRIYSENGDEVKIETNPLSVLTPGFLQRIFD